MTTILSCGDGVQSLAFAPSGNTLACGLVHSTTIRLWDLSKARWTRKLPPSERSRTAAPIWALAFVSEEELVFRSAPGPQQSALGSWDLSTREPRTLRSLGWPSGLTCCPATQELMYCHGVMEVVAYPSLAKVATREEGDDLLCVACSPDGQVLAWGGWDQTVTVWKRPGKRSILQLKGHEAAVLSVAVSPDGKKVLSGGWDYRVRVWDAATGFCVTALDPHQRGVTCVACSPDNRFFASGSRDQTVVLYDAETCRPLHTLTHHSGIVSALAFSPDGQSLASASWDGTVVIVPVAGFAGEQKE